MELNIYINIYIYIYIYICGVTCIKSDKEAGYKLTCIIYRKYHFLSDPSQTSLLCDVWVNI